MEFKLSERDVLRTRILEDQNGDWGLYIVPMDAEICITETELREALAQIETSKYAVTPTGEPNDE